MGSFVCLKSEIKEAAFGKGIACDTLSLSKAPFGKGAVPERGLRDCIKLFERSEYQILIALMLLQSMLTVS